MCFNYHRYQIDILKINEIISEDALRFLKYILIFKDYLLSFIFQSCSIYLMSANYESDILLGFEDTAVKNNYPLHAYSLHFSRETDDIQIIHYESVNC